MVVKGSGWVARPARRTAPPGFPLRPSNLRRKPRPCREGPQQQQQQQQQDTGAGGGRHLGALPADRPPAPGTHLAVAADCVSPQGAPGVAPTMAPPVGRMPRPLVGELVGTLLMTRLRGAPRRPRAAVLLVFGPQGRP
ncbi:hypothetical protein P7K49_030314 [Saguinus oedipus]|uniref:Uncharacterized protein n=1 Tax=Saguinus oedipus TaxID=9490 RepID=A0ABQ9U2S0_SAGOE|nr:hypothetical protein P7K49_030314 [Saguinus oedipus]